MADLKALWEAAKGGRLANEIANQLKGGSSVNLMGLGTKSGRANLKANMSGMKSMMPKTPKMKAPNLMKSRKPKK